MQMKDVIRQKRREYGLTQEQVADRLGVTAPAVNKWESGATYPDVSLLTPLARLLRTDLNTLLCFREELTKEDVAGYINEVTKLAWTEGAGSARERIREIVKEYPSNGELLYQMGTMLRGISIITANTAEEIRENSAYAAELYRQAAECDDVRAADYARYALASMYIQEGEYEKAQNLIDCLPEENAMDKRQLQISILMKQKEYKEAARLLEQSISASLHKANLQLNLLADAAVKEGDTDRAWKLAEYSGKVMEIYGWEYFTHMTAFTVAMGEKDADRSIEFLKKMLESLEDAEGIRKSILFVHAEMKDGDMSVWKQMGKNLLMSMEREEEFAFLRDRDDFRELVRKYS